jgi:hypothetical protein
MLSLRYDGEEGVEGDDAVYFAQGPFESFRHCILYFAGQITEDLLGFVECADDRAGLPLIRGDPLVELGELRRGELVCGTFRYMMYVFPSLVSSSSLSE